MRQFYDTFSTPIGDFSVALAADNSVIATAFGSLEELRERFTPDEVIHDRLGWIAHGLRFRRRYQAQVTGTRRRSGGSGVYRSDPAAPAAGYI